MSVGIECPVCEAVFSVKEVSGKTGIRCPECKRKFRYSKEILTKRKSVKATEKPAAKTTSKAKTRSKPPAVKSELSSTKSKSPSSKSKPPAKKAKPRSDNTTNKATTKKSKRSKKSSKWKTTATEAPRLQTLKPTHDSDPKPDATASDSSEALDQLPIVEKLDQLPIVAKPGQPSGQFELVDDNAESESNVLAAIHARKKEKAKRQTIFASVAIVTLLIATAILGFVLYRQLKSPNDLLAGETPDTPKTAAVNTVPKAPSLLGPSKPDQTDDWPTTIDDPILDEPEEEEPQEIELPRVLAKDLPRRDFEYFQQKELRLVWQRIRPRLISFAVRTDLGVKHSVGTIVDSRGWALTSNQFVSKWPDVKATAAARNIDAYYEDLDARKPDGDSPAGLKLLTDVSRGIASAQPKRDQTLLALNPRFVVALDKFEFASRESIVSGLYLVQAAPPSPNNPYGFDEIKVHDRQEFEELETEARNKAKALKIDDPLTTWIVATKKDDTLVGTPVFNRTGQMVGTYAFSTKQFAYFVFIDQAPKLIARAAKAGADKGELKQVNAEIELLSPSHEMARPSELLNRTGLACEAFNFIPSDADQYKQLQKFSRRFVTVAKFIQDNQDDASDSVSLSILSDQIKRWQKKLSRGVRNAYKQTPEKLKQLNALAVEKLAVRKPNTANTYIPFVGEFYSRGIDEDTNEESILMTIDKKSAVIKVPFSGSIRGMRPGTQWLCFYRRPARLTRSYIKVNSNPKVPLYYNGNILRVLGPIEKR